MRSLLVLFVVFFTSVLSAQNYVKNYSLNGIVAQSQDYYLQKILNNYVGVYYTSAPNDTYSGKEVNLSIFNPFTGEMMSSQLISLGENVIFQQQLMGAYYEENSGATLLIHGEGYDAKIMRVENNVVTGSQLFTEVNPYVQDAMLAPLGTNYYVVGFEKAGEIVLYKLNRANLSIQDSIVINATLNGTYNVPGIKEKVHFLPGTNGNIIAAVPTVSGVLLKEIAPDFSTVTSNQISTNGNWSMSNISLEGGQMLITLFNDDHDSKVLKVSSLDLHVIHSYNFNDIGEAYFIAQKADGNYFLSTRTHRLWLGSNFNIVDGEYIDGDMRIYKGLKISNQWVFPCFYNKVGNMSSSEYKALSLIGLKTHDEFSVFPQNLSLKANDLNITKSTHKDIAFIENDTFVSGVSRLNGFELYGGGVVDHAHSFLFGKDSSSQADLISRCHDIQGVGALKADGSINTKQRQEDFNKVWKVTSEMIDEHIQNYQNTGYEMPASIRDWPAHGYPSLDEPYNIAPFVDVNQNQNYDPENGDYPAIKGDYTLLTILNGKFFSQGMPVEIVNYSYAFNCNDPALKNSVFSHFKVINRSDQVVIDSLWFLGHFYGRGQQDSTVFTQTHVAQNMVYDFADGSTKIGASAYKVLKGVKKVDDGYDNGNGAGVNEWPYGINFGNGVVDDEYYKLTKSQLSYYIPPGSSWPDPDGCHYSGEIFLDYYNQLQNMNARYFMPDDTDPYNLTLENGQNANYWNVHNPEQVLTSYGKTGSGPSKLRPHQEMSFDVSYIITEASGQHPQSDTAMLFDYGQQIETYFENNQTPCGQSFGYYVPVGALDINEKFYKESVEVYPNPTRSYCIIESNTKLQSVQVYDFQGRVVLQRAALNDNRIMLNTQELQAGVYVVVIRMDEGSIESKKLVVTR